MPKVVRHPPNRKWQIDYFACSGNRAKRGSDCTSRTFAVTASGQAADAYLSSRTDEIFPLNFTVEGRLDYVTVPSRVTVGGADAIGELTWLGTGPIQASRYRFVDDFAAGTLTEVLADYPPSPTPLVALYPQNLQLSPHVGDFLDWAAGISHRPIWRHHSSARYPMLQVIGAN